MFRSYAQEDPYNGRTTPRSERSLRMAEHPPETAAAPSLEQLVLDFYEGLQYEAKRLHLGTLDGDHAILAPRLRRSTGNVTRDARANRCRICVVTPKRSARSRP